MLMTVIYWKCLEIEQVMSVQCPEPALDSPSLVSLMRLCMLYGHQIEIWGVLHGL
jgi:hypothetical protein